MIKISIKDEKELGDWYLGKIKSLVQERINFYELLLNFYRINNDHTFKKLIEAKTTAISKTSLVNIFLLKEITKQSEIKAKFISGELKSIIFIDHAEKILKLVKNHLEIILTGPLEELLNIKNEYEALKTDIDFSVNFCKNIFDYQSFTGQNDDWNFSHSFTSKLDLNVCPYCNRNFITTVLNDTADKIIGPSIDHFLPISDNPLFGVSLYNLIPSCTVCNSNLKHQIPFDDECYLYPYKDELGDEIYFDFDFIDFDTENKSSANNYKLKLIPNPHVNTDYEKKLRGVKSVLRKDQKGSLSVFMIEEIYDFAHRDIVGELNVKCDVNNPYYAKSVLSLLNKTDSIDEFYQFYFGNYLNKTDWNKRPLAKLTYDIVSKRLKEFEDQKIKKGSD